MASFRDNVMVQVKNGPLDFQPREPFHPLFGAMPKTPLMGELQITQEYLGHANHLVYLAPMWKEFLDADTHARGAGSSVAALIDGSVEAKRRTGMAGVANTGRDMNWTGHHFAQANWYAYGRLAWDPGLSAEAIADEWIRMTWGHASTLIATIRSIMLESREAFVRYTMPLGLHHLIGGDHYAPMPENDDPRREDWSAIFYHRANASGIGVDRTSRGTDAVAQYRSPLRERWSDPATTPDELLLWFHRLPWDYRLKSGRTLWEGLVESYNRGAEEARAFETRWMTLHGSVDEERYQAVLARLRRQAEDAAAWRDKCSELLPASEAVEHALTPAPARRAGLNLRILPPSLKLRRATVALREGGRGKPGERCLSALSQLIKCRDHGTTASTGPAILFPWRPAPRRRRRVFPARDGRRGRWGPAHDHGKDPCLVALRRRARGHRRERAVDLSRAVACCDRLRQTG